MIGHKLVTHQTGPAGVPVNQVMVSLLLYLSRILISEDLSIVLLTGC